tara:strand:- start:137 stop:526 length:390 start_codon:yes stop_codon:yes gene_type:complete
MEIGAVFQEKRMEKGMTLKEVENATSIHHNYLDAIESGEDKGLSSAYVQGFMRQYAGFLGLDVEDLKSKFPTAFAEPDAKHDFAYGIGTLEMRSNASGGVRWLPNLLWASAAALIVVAAWYFAKLLKLI